MAYKIRSIKENFAMNLLLTGSSILFPLITFPLVSRALFEEAYGLVGFASAMATWLSLIAMLGVNRYGVREVARVRDDAVLLAKTTREILTVTCISTVIVYIGFIISLFLVERFSADRLLFFINGFTVLCNTLGVAWFFQGIEQYRYITIRGVIIKLVCLIGVILFVHVPGDYLVYAVLLVASAAAANLVNFFYMLKICRDGIREQHRPTHHEKLDLKRHIRPLMTFFVIVAAISIYSVLDTVMLGFLSTDAQVGFYTADVNIKSALVAVVSALSGVLLPRASNLLANGKQAQYKDIIRKALCFVAAFSVPVCIVGAIVATPLISWYAGPSFAGAGPALSVVVLAVIPIGFSVIFCDEVMIPLGMESKCTYIYIAAALIDFMLNLLLIPSFGALGAAISTTSVELLIAVVEFVIIRKYLWGGPNGGGVSLDGLGVTQQAKE